MIGGVFQAAATLAAAGAQSSAEKKAAKERKKALEAAKKEVGAAYDDADYTLQEFRNGQTRYATDEMKQAYTEGLANYDPTKYVAERGTFDKSKYDIADYINNNRDKIVQSASDAVQRSAAGAGIGRGTGTAMDIAQAVADKDMELENQAYQRMQDDRNFDYNEFQAQYQANQARLDKLAQGFTTRMEMLGGAIEHDDQQEADYMADYLNLKTGRANANVNLLT